MIECEVNKICPHLLNCQNEAVYEVAGTNICAFDLESVVAQLLLGGYLQVTVRRPS